jgi:tetratricopeptide (TPR) repeat protein
MNKKQWHEVAVKTILELAVEQHPTSSIVYSRWGDYYLKMNDKATALKYYEKGLDLDPNDQQIKENLNSLKK